MLMMATLVYCVHEERVLLIKRRKNPFAGYWVAPGGKIEIGESPHECATREFVEETGLRPHTMFIRGIISEVSPRPDWQWLIFVYLVTKHTGVMKENALEGSIAWWKTVDISKLKIPESDKLFWRRSINLASPVFEIKCMYDSHLDLIGVQEHPECII